MTRRPIVAIAAGAILLLAACSSGGASTAPTAAATAAAPSVAASAPAAASPASAGCTESATGGEVPVAIKDFAFSPAAIQASVGQNVSFTNSDSAPHTATLDDGSCTTSQIAQGGTDGLIFSAAGTYPFHCEVHPNMKGTITVS
jgi:plastocyanin